MIAIDNVLISDDLLTQNFVCNLKACKGACCWEGDYGAPVKKKEMGAIQANMAGIKPLLSEESHALLAKNNGFEYYDEAETWGTSCHPDGACVFLVRNELGIAMCGIELAHKQGKSMVNKPISCHLYPLRVNENEDLNLESWNYERWDICSAACSNGDQLKVPVYAFLEEAIVRYKGQVFFDQLKAAAERSE